MNRQEYIRQLEAALARIDKEERESALEYYNEYFDEAGEDQEQAVIDSLGSPQKLASQIKAQCAMKRLESQETPTVKKGLSAVWLVILGIFAAPVALPLAIAAAAVVLSLVVASICVLIAIILLTIALFAAGVITVVAGFLQMVASPATALFFVGAGIALIGGTLLTGVLAFGVTAAFIRFLARALSRNFSGKEQQVQKEVLRDE